MNEVKLIESEFDALIITLLMALQHSDKRIKNEQLTSIELDAEKFYYEQIKNILDKFSK